MTKISASILSADFTSLGEDCRNVLDAGADMLHFDVMDGRFVPNISYGEPVLQSLHRAMPEVFYDVHLMVEEPLRHVPAFAAAGASIITFHLEAAGENTGALISAINALGCGAGLSVRPGTPIQAVYPYLEKLALVLVMSVEPGFGGQDFQPAALARLEALRSECARRGVAPYLEVDGGINAATGRQCLAAGANLLVMGSALFGAAERKALIADLKTAR